MLCSKGEGDTIRARAQVAAKYHDAMSQAHWAVTMGYTNDLPDTLAEARRQLTAKRAHQTAAESYRQCGANDVNAWEKAELDASWAANRTSVCKTEVRVKP